VTGENRDSWYVLVEAVVVVLVVGESNEAESRHVCMYARMEVGRRRRQGDSTEKRKEARTDNLGARHAKKRQGAQICISDWRGSNSNGRSRRWTEQKEQGEKKRVRRKKNGVPIPGRTS
jgi:hypothetical protein